MNLVLNLKHWIALSLVVSLGLWLAGCAKETTAPVKPVTNGAPKKLPQAGSTAGPGAEVPEQSETSKEPAAKSDDKPADDKPAEEKKSDDKPADEKPAEEKKSDDKPAEEKPAAEKKSDDKPPEEKPAEEQKSE